ncbi:MAG: class I SAM-dependent methyltransferase [Candidatus Nanohaloarchaea archaeon]|nr:class I SAM-dependent methyltransferase [Candidatus Nanohaloarchaea archaeon]
MEPERFYTEIAAAYDADNSWEQLPDSYIDVVERFTDAVKEGAVLDAGCGPGRDTEYFEDEGFDATGVDLAAGMVEYADEHREGEYLRGDLRELPFDDRAFDGVWCNAAVFLLPWEEMQGAVDELYRVTDDGGAAQISFKLGEGELQKQRDDNEVTQYLVTDEGVRSMLEEAGYEVVDAEHHELPGFAFGNYFVER